MEEKTFVEKLATGIAGFDLISNGGLPKGRTTLVAGTAGSGKTIFAAQFLAEGIIKNQEPGVFITFEESPQDISKNLSSLGWTIRAWENERQWLFVDASPNVAEEPVLIGSYDLAALLARIEHAVHKIGAKRVAMDSLDAMFSRVKGHSLIRQELFRIASALKKMGVTALMTAERTVEHGEITRYGVEEFVADNVIILRNVLEEEKRRRTIEILKFRGTSHQKGEFAFTITPPHGMMVVEENAKQ